MPDYGSRVADRAIADIEKQLRSTYRTARKELREKLKDFEQSYARKSQEKLRQFQRGEITMRQYADWLSGQVFIRNQWKRKIDQAAKVLGSSNQQATNIINSRSFDVFAENYNFFAFQAERMGIGTSFDVYNSQSVARLIKDEPEVLPKWKIDEEKDYKWNYKKVNNSITQGIIQGESVDDIMKRLVENLCTQNENKMRTFARTAITGAQNAGRQRQMEDAADMGIDVHKKWLATLDSRTRDTHRAMDGEEVPHNENFSNGLEYPGDPSGKPSEVYNCRCTMISVYPKYNSIHESSPRRAYAEYEEEDGTQRRRSYLTTNQAEYNKWKNEKKGINYAGEINKTHFKNITDDITTNEVIITNERIDHCNRHNNAYDRLKQYIPDILSDPDYIFDNKTKDSAILVKRIIDAGKAIELILRLHTSLDESGRKNSIISYWDISEKTVKRYLRNKKVVYKRDNG